MIEKPYSEEMAGTEASWMRNRIKRGPDENYAEAESGMEEKLQEFRRRYNSRNRFRIKALQRLLGDELNAETISSYLQTDLDKDSNLKALVEGENSQFMGLINALITILTEHNPSLRRFDKPLREIEEAMEMLTPYHFADAISHLRALALVTKYKGKKDPTEILKRTLITELFIGGVNIPSHLETLVPKRIRRLKRKIKPHDEKQKEKAERADRYAITLGELEKGTHPKFAARIGEEKAGGIKKRLEEGEIYIKEEINQIMTRFPNPAQLVDSLLEIKGGKLPI